MKKIILLLGLLLIAGNSAFADCEYECVAPYNLNNKFRVVMSNITGINSIVENKLENIIEKEVLKIASADKIEVNLDSYSPKDLKNGIFKSMEVSGENVVINNIHLSYLNLKTLCDFNYIKQSGNEIVFVESLPMSFNFKMTSSDLNKTMQNAKYKKILKDFNKLASNYSMGLQISSTKISIKSNKLYYVIALDIPFVSNEPKITLQADLRVKDGKIDFNNTRLISNSFNIDLKRLDFILNYLNPLNFSVNILENKDAKVTVKNVILKDNMVVADGVIVIPKD
ncbi:hypothetical protein IJ541_00025 [bacterium]|nr:hypothetical protein [bacterium]